MNYETIKETGLRYALDMMTPMSGIGAKMLRAFPVFFTDKKELEAELDRVDFFLSLLKKTPAETEKLNTLLMRIKDISTSLKAVGSRDLLDTELFEVKAFCLACCEAEALFSALGLEKVGLTLRPLSEPLSFLGSGEGFYIDDGFSPELNELRQKRKALMEKRKKGEDISLELSQTTALEYKKYCEVLSDISRKLAPFGEDMYRNLLALGQADVALQKATTAARHNLSRPVISDKLALCDATNPMIAACLESLGNAFCPITITAEKGVTVITGANMGGKTVALKTIALNVALALSGCFVFASSACVPLFDSVEVAALDAQDQEKGLSSFAADVLRLDSLYKKNAKGKSLILSDEFASGTNALEGSAIFRAFVAAFSQTQNTVIMTTHFDGVALNASARYQVKGISCRNFDEINSPMGADAVRRYMDYGLIPIEKGAPMPKDAVKICKLLGLSATILDNLKDIY